MSQPASNRQRKFLTFCGVKFGPEITVGGATWEIIRLLRDPSIRERWRRYVFLTRDFDSDTDDLQPFEQADLDAVVVPEGWQPEAAVQEFDEEIAQRVFEEEGPYDSPAPAITYEGKAYCFTGEFDIGKRSVCEKRVKERGGTTPGGVSREIDYLVVGTKGSAAWKHDNYGRKIERAIVIRRETGRPAIVSEDAWRQSL